MSNIANDILGNGTNWDLIKKTLIGLALAGLGVLAIAVVRPRRH
ncbi:MAG TPA: hypothetical protein PKH97_03330 [Tetrasphaera sp.]|uniref:LPXTG cell wall anchor domain-containing protein n=1 Tax=Nostocoides vanveenii TaxID=330835 RepID=A0ABP4WZJ8_9MICO|nr:hypothetical protein [Tetrasphaera sp.]HNQ06197.1 hypothetical protein [Tetrasphaera sp.]